MSLWSSRCTARDLLMRASSTTAEALRMTASLLPGHRIRFIVVLFIAAGTAAGGWFAIARGKTLLAQTLPAADEANSVPQVTAEVVLPRPGGLDRVSIQVGTVEPFAAAELYAKASGFLIEQTVDIGSRVEKDEILARISVPEYEKQVDRDEARVRAADAKVRQMDAHLTAAKAESKAADASITFAKVSLRAKTAYRKYREKQLNRIKDLVAQKALEGRLLDEQEDYYLSALESENAPKRPSWPLRSERQPPIQNRPGRADKDEPRPRPSRGRGTGKVEGVAITRHPIAIHGRYYKRSFAPATSSSRRIRAGTRRSRVERPT